MLKLRLQYFGHLMWRADSFEKTLMLGKIEGRRRRDPQRMRWLDDIHYPLNEHEFGQALWVVDGQGSLACCNPWGCKELDMTQRLSQVQLLAAPSLSPRACSNSCPLSRWYHPPISSPVIPFSSCLQSFPASGSFPMSQFFVSGDQIIGASASASVLPMNIRGWFPLGWTGWISLQSKGLSRVFSNTTVQKHQFFGVQLYSPTLTSIHGYWKNHSFD